MHQIHLIAIWEEPERSKLICSVEGLKAWQTWEGFSVTGIKYQPPMLVIDSR